MAKENTILAIDVGGDSLKMAEFVVPPSGGLVLNKYAISEYDESIGETDFMDRFLSAYRRMLAEHKFKSKQVRVTISGQHAFSRLSKLPPLTENQAQVVQIIEFEAKQTVPYPMDEVVWSYQLIRHSGNRNHQVQDEGEAATPNEYDADQDELEALFVAVKADLVSGIADVIQDSGKDILSIEMAPTAIYNAAKANNVGSEGCDMVLNIGGRCSCLVFFDQTRIYVRTIPIAGDTITQQIAKEFNIGFSDAEALKRRHCFIALGGAYEDPDSETAATISKIARNVMTRLHGEINRSINQWRSQYDGNKPVRMLLSGGSSIIQYAPHFFCEKLRIPVEYLNVFPVVGITEEIDKEKLREVAPLFPELVGLGLRHCQDCPIQISLMPLSIKRHEILQKKKPYLYASAISAIFCLIVFYWLISARKGYDMRRVELTASKVEETEKRVAEVREATGKLQKAETAYKDALEILKQRGQWFAILNELQRITPDYMWFTTIEGAPEEMNLSLGGMGMGMPGAGMMGPMAGGAAGGMAGGPGGGMSSASSIGGLGMGLAESLPDYEWIVLYGHSLVMDKATVLPEDIFRERVQQSALFDSENESFKYEHLQADAGSNNVTAFKVKIKLKEPIKQ